MFLFCHWQKSNKRERAYPKDARSRHLTILGKDLSKSVRLIVCVCFCPSKKSFFYWIKSSLSSN